MQDLAFSLSGKSIPEDHAFGLRDVLVRWLPWLAEEPGAGIHAIHGVATHGRIFLSHRTRLVLRLPEERLDAARALCGKTLEVEGEALMVGAASAKPLPRFGTLYAHFVHTGPADETEFCTLIRAELEALGTDCGFLCGKPRHVQAGDELLHGFSVMLHSVTLKESIALQQAGLGKYRLLGGGILIPHKSIRAVRAEDDDE